MLDRLPPEALARVLQHLLSLSLPPPLMFSPGNPERILGRLRLVCRRLSLVGNTFNDDLDQIFHHGTNKTVIAEERAEEEEEEEEEEEGKEGKKGVKKVPKRASAAANRRTGFGSPLSTSCVSLPKVLRRALADGLGRGIGRAAVTMSNGFGLRCGCGSCWWTGVPWRMRLEARRRAMREGIRALSAHVASPSLPAAAGPGDGDGEDDDENNNRGNNNRGNNNNSSNNNRNGNNQVGSSPFLLMAMHGGAMDPVAPETLASCGAPVPLEVATRAVRDAVQTLSDDPNLRRRTWHPGCGGDWWESVYAVCDAIASRASTTVTRGRRGPQGKNNSRDEKADAHVPPPPALHPLRAEVETRRSDVVSEFSTAAAGGRPGAPANAAAAVRLAPYIDARRDRDVVLSALARCLDDPLGIGPGCAVLLVLEFCTSEPLESLVMDRCSAAVPEDDDPISSPLLSSASSSSSSSSSSTGVATVPVMATVPSVPSVAVRARVVAAVACALGGDPEWHFDTVRAARDAFLSGGPRTVPAALFSAAGPRALELCVAMGLSISAVDVAEQLTCGNVRFLRAVLDSGMLDGEWETAEKVIMQTLGREGLEDVMPCVEEHARAIAARSMYT